MGTRQWLSVGRVDVRMGSGGRAPRGAAVGARERLPVVRRNVPVRGVGRAPRGAEVGARERLSLERLDARKGGDEGVL